VERPVVVEEGDARLLRADRGAILGTLGEEVGVARERRLHRRIAVPAVLEVLAIPVEDLGDLQLARGRIASSSCASSRSPTNASLRSIGQPTEAHTTATCTRGSS